MRKDKFYLSTLLSFLILVILISGCKKDEDENDLGIPDAKIHGIVTSPNGRTIGNALIVYGNYSTYSDHKGEFTIDVFHGNQDFIIQTSNGVIFKTTLKLKVKANETLNLISSQTILKQVGNLAYITGAYDKIESIIIDTLGYSADSISVDDLDNLSILANYNALFLNCGSLLPNDDMMDSLKYTNLSAFLTSHGSIYASDWAVQFLTGDDNWRAAGSVNFVPHTSASTSQVQTTCFSPLLGGFIPDSSLCTSKTGSSTLVQNAEILDQGIINAIGDSLIDINYDLPQWEVIDNVALPMNIIISDNSGYGALAVKSNRYSNEYGGLIFYTTFHNEVQGSVGPKVNQILQYFILNL